MSEGVVIAIITVVGAIAAAIITAVLSRKPTPPPQVHVSVAEPDKTSQQVSDRRDPLPPTETKRPTPTPEPSEPEQVISKSGKGNFQSLSQALAAIEEGATLRIKPGVYLESAEWVKSFELSSDGDPSRTVLTAKGGNFVGSLDGSAWTLLMGRQIDPSVRQIVIRGVTLRGRAKDGTLDWKDGELVLENCVVEGGICLRGRDCRLVMRNCVVRGGEVGLTLLLARAVTIENTKFSTFGFCAMLLQTCPDFQLVGCEIEGCPIGINVSGKVVGTVNSCRFRNVDHELEPPEGSSLRVR